MSFWNSVKAYFSAENKPEIPDFILKSKEELPLSEEKENTDAVSGQFFSGLMDNKNLAAVPKTPVIIPLPDFDWTIFGSAYSDEMFDALLGFWADNLRLDTREIGAVQELMKKVFVEKHSYIISFEWRATFERDMLKLMHFIYQYRGYTGNEIFYALLESYFVCMCLYIRYKDNPDVSIRKIGYVTLLEGLLAS